MNGSYKIKALNKSISTIAIILVLLFQSLSYAMAEEDPDELYRQGRFDEAEKAYATLDMDHPKNIRYRYNRGCAAFQKSDYNGALASFSSVLKRTKDQEIRFKAFYNLGNTAFKNGNFEIAAEQFKKAILLDPENEDAKYNLELALLEIEKSKKNEQQGGQKKEASSPAENKDGKSDKKEKGKQSDNTEENKDVDRKQSENQHNKSEGKESSTGEEQSDKKEGSRATDSGNNEKGNESHQDLSGNLEPMQDMPDKNESETLPQAKAGLDRKKAEALLDNLNENRGRFQRFNIPKEKKGGVASGKDW